MGNFFKKKFREKLNSAEKNFKNYGTQRWHLLEVRELAFYQDGKVYRNSVKSGPFSGKFWSGEEKGHCKSRAFFVSQKAQTENVEHCGRWGVKLGKNARLQQLYLPPLLESMDLPEVSRKFL